MQGNVTAPLAIQEIKRSVREGGCFIESEQDAFSVRVGDALLNARYIVPLDLWLAHDNTAFDFGVSSALLDSTSGETATVDLSQQTFVPGADAEAMENLGIEINAAEYWAGYNLIATK
jgi:hypothetical protein